MLPLFWSKLAVTHFMIKTLIKIDSHEPYEIPVSFATSLMMTAIRKTISFSRFLLMIDVPRPCTMFDVFLAFLKVTSLHLIPLVAQNFRQTP